MTRSLAEILASMDPAERAVVEGEIGAPPAWSVRRRRLDERDAALRNLADLHYGAEPSIRRRAAVIARELRRMATSPRKAEPSDQPLRAALADLLDLNGGRPIGAEQVRHVLSQFPAGLRG